MLFLIIASCVENQLSENTNSSSDNSTDGGGDNNSEGDNQLVTKTGIFLDSAVEGIDYISGTLSGQTDGSGKFEYYEGSDVSFTVGGVSLGTTQGASTLTPVELVEGANSDTDSVVNIARFLQTLDADGDPSNGITITPAVSKSLKDSNASVQFNVSPEKFEETNSGPINTIKQIPLDNGSTRSLISKASAKGHLDQTKLFIEQGASDLVPPYSGKIILSDNKTTTQSISIKMTISAQDNHGVASWYASESPKKPEISSSGWNQITPPRRNYSANVDFVLSPASSSSDNYRLVYIWFKDTAGFISRRAQDSILLSITDFFKPTNKSLQINSGATSTSSPDVTLNLSASDDSGIQAYLISNDNSTPTASDSRWKNVTVTKNYQESVSYVLLSGADVGSFTRKIYSWFKDLAGNISDKKEASITLIVNDSTPPVPTSISINSGAESTSQTGVQIKFTGTDNIGISGYFLSESGSKPELNRIGWVSINESDNVILEGISYSLIGATDIGKHSRKVYLWLRDKAGNISESINDSIDLEVSDLESPSTPSLSINNNAATTTSVNVSVLISGTDNHGITGYLISESSITPGVSSEWVSINSTKSLSQSVSFTLSSSEGEKKVYAWIKDDAGNISGAGSDSVDLNSKGYVRGYFGDNYFLDQILFHE